MEKSVRRRIAIVTDSTADIPARLLKEYDIHVIPQILIMGDKTWLDGVDIDPPAFYELLRSSPDCPSTSQPSIASFQELFRKLSREAEGVVAVLISDDLSGTLNSAQAAAASLPDVPVELVDTRGASMQLGFMVLAAARAAAAGEGLETVAAAARALVGRVQVYFVVDTLEYLHRGGRIGAAAKLLGSALDLKPVLEIRDGIVKPLARVRTRRKALRKVFDLLDEQLAGKDRIHMAVLHVAAPHEAAHLKEQFISCFHPVEMIETECGPVVGAHAGPGTVGVVFYAEDS
jgi:DegV family protein with EDD domain